MELRGERPGACRILFQEQTDDIASVVHAAGGIDARSDLKGHLAVVAGIPFPSPATSSNACRPGFATRLRPSSPYLTMTRFSPVRGTTSATVARAASLRNDFNMRVRFSEDHESVVRRA